MKFEEFRTEICNYLQKRLEKDCVIRPYDNVKNDYVQKGIAIHIKYKEKVPVLYIDKIYEKYMFGKLTLREIQENILLLAQIAVGKNQDVHENIPIARDWEEDKYSVIAKLVNTERNLNMIRKMPHKEICNLTIMFYLKKREEDDKIEGIPVTYNLMCVYGVDEDTLLEQAIENMNRNDMRLYEISDMGGELKEPIGVLKNEEEFCNTDEMHFLTTKTGIWGASIVLSPSVRRTVLQKFRGAVYFLPSSIHEWIVLPRLSKYTPDELLELVKEVNAKVVPNSDFLADNVYLLTRDAELVLVA